MRFILQGGMVAGMNGAVSIFETDGDAEVVEKCKLNLKKNGFRISSDDVDIVGINADRLKKNSNEKESKNSISTLKKEEVHVQSEVLWWGSNDLKNLSQRFPIGFDIIIGSELLYEQKNVIPLFETVSHLLSLRRAALKAHPTLEETVFVMSFQRRTVSIESVFEESQKRGLTAVIEDRYTKSIFDEPCNFESALPPPSPPPPPPFLSFLAFSFAPPPLFVILHLNSLFSLVLFFSL